MSLKSVEKAKSRMKKMAEQANEPPLKLNFNSKGKLAQVEEQRLFNHIFNKLQAAAS